VQWQLTRGGAISPHVGHRDSQKQFTRLLSGYGGQGYRILPQRIAITCAKMRENIRHLRFTHFLAFQIAPPHSQRDEVAAPRHAPHRNEKRERFADENDRTLELRR